MYMKLCMNSGIEYIITDVDVIEDFLDYLRDKAVPNYFFEVLNQVYVNPSHISSIEFEEN
ncbi:hypothetical protein GCM10008983_28130 [Lentibacillus halophilus]|uniref:Uncharacterized protein n=1 Tax=Lentibacillus halophilus TaxID=295065 RepID=A0ABP3JBV0_9BACI